jgi:hypothetical protein
MGTTPIYGFPYPDPSDLVANYPALGQELAEDIEAVLPTLGGMAFLNSTALSGSSVSIDNVFTSTYSTYKIIVAANVSTNVTGRIRLRAAGVDLTSSVYVEQALTGTSTTASAAATTRTELIFGTGGTSNPRLIDMTLQYPAESRVKNVLYNQGASTFVSVLQNYIDNSSVYDGLTIAQSSGTFTGGSVSIYGMRKT